jgi:hypothetical protein
MMNDLTQTYDRTQSVEAPPDVCDPAAEYRKFFATAYNSRVDEELCRASRTAKLSAYLDTRSFWIKQQQERLAETANPDFCCFCFMPRQPGRAALRHVDGLESAQTRRHRVPNLRAHQRCVSAFRFMLSKRADATLVAYGLTPDFDD